MTPNIKLRILVMLSTILCIINSHAQHDPGRNSMRFIAKEDYQKAADVISKGPSRSNSDVNDAERAYVRALMACKQGNLELALEETKTAIELGMPIGRFIAGPRDAFEKLYELKGFQSLKNQADPKIHGPMLGNVTDTSASIWVRTEYAQDVVVTARLSAKNGHSLKPSNTQISATQKSTKETDYTAVVTLENLKPNTHYDYNIRLGDDPDAPIPAESISAVYSFKTQPAYGKPAKFSVAFGGGAGFTPKHEHMWTTIKKQDVNALLLLGDNVYIDDPEHQLTQLYCYYRRQSQPLWRDLVSGVGVYTIYDDHDFGMDDCNPGPKIDEPAWKPEVWKTFVNNWNNPGYGGGEKQPGCWYTFQIADVQFIMLDGRYYRDLEGGSMIGPVQKAWLFDTLKSSTATFKVIASPVPWSPGVKGGSRDTWDGFLDEREAIFSFIEKLKINGVLLMAADRHRSDMRKIVRPNGYDLYEVMSSRLTNVHTHGLMENAKGSEFIMGYNEKCSFGRIDFDTTAKSPTITYTMINIDGENVGTQALDLKTLSFPQ